MVVTCLVYEVGLNYFAAILFVHEVEIVIVSSSGLPYVRCKLTQQSLRLRVLLCVLTL